MIMAGALSCSPLVPPSFSSLATRASIVSILVLTEASCSWCPLHSTLISAIWSLDSARCACIVASSRPTMSLSWPTAICSSPRKRSRRASMVNAGWSPLPLFCGLVSRLRRSEGAAVEAAGESPPSVAIATGMLINGLAPAGVVISKARVLFTVSMPKSRSLPGWCPRKWQAEACARRQPKPFR